MAFMEQALRDDVDRLLTELLKMERELIAVKNEITTLRHDWETAENAFIDMEKQRDELHANTASLKCDIHGEQEARIAAEKQRNELLAIVERYRNETPLGNQPHMIAHIADAAIAKVKGGA